MDGFRVLEIKKSVFENNDREADRLRAQLKKDRTFLPRHRTALRGADSGIRGG